MKQPKKPIGLSKPKMLTAKRVNEIADSLMKESKEKKSAAYQQRSIGQATIKNKVADKKLIVDNYGSILSGRDRLKISEDYFKQASSDSANSVRYRKLANNASKKK